MGLTRACSTTALCFQRYNKASKHNCGIPTTSTTSFAKMSDARLALRQCTRVRYAQSLCREKPVMLPPYYISLIPRIRTKCDGTLLPMDVIWLIREFLGTARLTLHLVSPSLSCTLRWWGFEKMSAIFFRLFAVRPFAFQCVRFWIGEKWIRQDEIDICVKSIWDYGIEDGQVISMRLLRFVGTTTTQYFQTVRQRAASYGLFRPSVRQSVRVARIAENATNTVYEERRYNEYFR